MANAKAKAMLSATETSASHSERSAAAHIEAGNKVSPGTPRRAIIRSGSNRKPAAAMIQPASISFAGPPRPSQRSTARSRPAPKPPGTAIHNARSAAAAPMPNCISESKAARPRSKSKRKA